MKLTKRQLLTAKQALGYAVMYAKTESETADFALLKLEIDGALIRIKSDKKMKAECTSNNSQSYINDDNNWK